MGSIGIGIEILIFQVLVLELVLNFCSCQVLVLVLVLKFGPYQVLVLVLVLENWYCPCLKQSPKNHKKVSKNKA